MVATRKPQLSIVVIGHIDSGKSTTAGHLLYKCGYTAQREMDKLERESAEIGKASFKYAWLFDKTKEERERGITVSISMARFETPKYVFTVHDAPGHRAFIKNMVAGATQADAALLVVPAGESEFQAGFAPTGQTREHALLAFCLGVKQMIVVVNKMDCESVRYAEARFNHVQREVSAHLAQLGFSTGAIPFVPVSGWVGDNLANRSENMPWYDGPSLLNALDTLSLPIRAVDKPLRVSIRDVYKIAGVGTVAVGRVETGTLRAGQSISFGPHGVVGTVRSIESHHLALAEALPGDQIGFTVTSISAKDVSRGCTASDPVLDPARAATEFTAQMIVLNAAGVIRAGYTPTVHCHTAHVPCRVKQITERIDRATGKVVELNPESVATGDACTVVLEPCKPFVVEAFQQYPQLGRFVIRDRHTTVAVGIIKAVKKAEK